MAGSALLGAVHHGVGLAEEGFGGGVGVVVAGDADAGPDLRRVVAEGDRLGDGRREGGREGDRLAGVGAMVEEDGELIPAEASDGRACGGAAAQAPRGNGQDDVPGGVAELVVDVLEAIQVDEEDGDAAGQLWLPGDGRCQLCHEVGAVGEAGEGIVGRLVEEMGFELALRGDVAEGAPEGGHARGLAAEVEGAFHDDAPPIPREEGRLEGRGRLAAQEARDAVLVVRPCFGGADVGLGEVMEGVAVVAEGGAPGAIDVVEVAGRVGDLDQLAGVVEELVQPRLALLERRLGARARGDVHGDVDGADQGAVLVEGGVLALPDVTVEFAEEVDLLAREGAADHGEDVGAIVLYCEDRLADAVAW